MRRMRANPHGRRPRSGGWAATAGIYSVLTLRPTGLFGVTNDAGTRWSGFAAAVGAAICLLAGPLFVGLVRKDRRWLAGSAAVIGLLSLSALATLTGG